MEKRGKLYKTHRVYAPMSPAVPTPSSATGRAFLTLKKKEREQRKMGHRRGENITLPTRKQEPVTWRCVRHHVVPALHMANAQQHIPVAKEPSS